MILAKLFFFTLGKKLPNVQKSTLGNLTGMKGERQKYIGGKKVDEKPFESSLKRLAKEHRSGFRKSL